MKKNWIIWSLLGFMAVVASACKDDDIDEAQVQKELLERQIKEIAAHLEQNNINAEPNALSIYQEVVEQNAAGELIESGDVAVVNYKISTLDGTLIGASEPGKPKRIVVSGGRIFFPQALYYGLQFKQPNNVHVGGTYRYYVPSRYGYGNYTDEQVPENANLIIEYEVVDVLRSLEEVYQAEQADIQAWLAQENLTAEELPRGLHKIVLQEGAGTTPVAGDSAWVRYKGYLLSKEVFDDNLEAEKPLAVELGTTSLVEGFTQAIKTMQPGEKSLFIMPSSLAYGTEGDYVLPREKRQSFIDKGAIGKRVGQIPPLSTLIFEIELERAE